MKFFEFEVQHSCWVLICEIVSCKVLHAITPSLLNQTSESSPLVKKNGCDYVGSDEDMGFSSGNLSSSLEKLCTWEKKLYNEVKVFEFNLKFHCNCLLSQFNIKTV